MQVTWIIVYLEYFELTRHTVEVYTDEVTEAVHSQLRMFEERYKLNRNDKSSKGHADCWSPAHLRRFLQFCCSGRHLNEFKNMIGFWTVQELRCSVRLLEVLSEDVFSWWARYLRQKMHGNPKPQVFFPWWAPGSCSSAKPLPKSVRHGSVGVRLQFVSKKTSVSHRQKYLTIAQVYQTGNWASGGTWGRASLLLLHIFVSPRSWSSLKLRVHP